MTKKKSFENKLKWHAPGIFDFYKHALPFYFCCQPLKNKPSDEVDKMRLWQLDEDKSQGSRGEVEMRNI